VLKEDIVKTIPAGSNHIIVKGGFVPDGTEIAQETTTTRMKGHP
jgi:hypothetical protein